MNGSLRMAKDEREREASHSVLLASEDSISQWLDGWTREWKWDSMADAEGRGRGSLLSNHQAVWPGYTTWMPEISEQCPAGLDVPISRVYIDRCGG